MQIANSAGALPQYRPRKQNEKTQSPALQLLVTTHLNLGGGPGDCNPAEESLHIVRCLTRRKVMQKRNLCAASLLPDASLRVHVLCLLHSMHTQRHVGLALSARESCISRIDERKEHNYEVASGVRQRATGPPQS